MVFENVNCWNCEVGSTVNVNEMGHFHVLTFTLNIEVYINEKHRKTGIYCQTWKFNYENIGNNKRQDLQQVIKLQTFIELFSLNW